MKDYKELIKALRCCGDATPYNHCEECPYEFQGEDCYNIETTAADAIERLVKERDAAIADFTIYIKHMEDGRKAFSCEFCNEENCDGCKHCNNFEWRGVQEDNDGLS